MVSILRLALRNLGRQRRRSLLLGSAIAVGLAVVTIVNGMSAGMIRTLEDNLSNLYAGHIFITGTQKTSEDKVVQRIEDASVLRTVVAELKVPVAFVSETSVAEQASLISDTDSASQTLYGVDLSPGSPLAQRLSVVKGSLDGFAGSDGILVSEGTAAKLGVGLGDRISVQAYTTTGQQNVVDFTVRGLYRDIGVASNLAGAYADRQHVNLLVNLPKGEFNQFGIYLKDISQTGDWVQRIYQALRAKNVALWPRGSDQSILDAQMQDTKWSGTKFLVQTLDDRLSIVKMLFTGLGVAAQLILVILYLVIMVGITNTYRMVIHERTREIGTLRALGMQAKQVRDLFKWEAVFLSIAGILAGFFVGEAVLVAVSLFDLSGWKDFTILLRNNHMVPAADWIALIVDLIIVTRLTSVAAGIPARKAAKMAPAEALRAQY